MLRPISLAVLSSLLTVLAFPKFEVSWLIWLAFIPLYDAAITSTTARRAFIVGFLSGLLSYVGLLYWIVVTFQAAHLSWGLAILALGALAGYLALYVGVWTLGIYRLRDETPLIVALTGGALWASLEWVRSFLFSGFPWALVADSQYRIPVTLQIVSWVGAIGLSGLVVAINGGIYALVPRRNGWKIATAFAGCSLSFLLLFGWARLRAGDQSLEPRAKVALLQGSIDQYKKWDQAYVEEIQRSYEALAEMASKGSPALVIWPETSVPGYLLQDQALRLWLERTVQRTRTHHIVGAPVWHEKLAYNSAFHLKPNGELGAEYTKQHLVPFGETVPFARFLGKWIGVLNALGGFSAKPGKAILPIEGHSVGVNICYEAIFPDLVRKSVRDGAEVIVNLTNDGWYMRTAAPFQHFAPNVLRAVENGRWVLRADNTGISAIVDPLGRIQKESPIFEPLVVAGDFVYRKEKTVYTRVGEFLIAACMLFSLTILGRRFLGRSPQS